MTTALDPDRNQLETFVNAMFARAGCGGYVSLRSFLPNNELLKPIKSIALNGSGSLAALVDAAHELALRAANHSKAVVFCPPIAVFQSDEGWQAREQDLFKGLVLSVECDEHPDESVWKLEEILGPPTAIVKSGGIWIDEDGQPRDKLHIHWRLKTPAMGEALAVLKEARRLATAIAGADPSNIPAVHCLRWPGSWHRKGTPRLCEMFAIFPDAEIDLETAVTALRAAAPTAPKTTPQTPTGDPAEWSTLIGDIIAGRNLHDSTTRLAAKCVCSNTLPGAVVNQLRALMDVSAARNERPADWKNRYDDIPRAVETAVQKYPRPGPEPAPRKVSEGPLPLFPEIPPGAPFPVEALGPVLASGAKAISRKVQVPLAMAAQSVLAVASLAACSHADVRLPFGQVRPITLYFMTVATSGDRKSTSDEEALWAIRKRERTLAEQREEELKIWRVAHAAWVAEKKKIEANRKMEFEERKACLRALGDEPLRPLEALLVTGDLTIEGLTKNWVNMRAALGIFTAEGGTFTGGHGMNQDNRLKTASALCDAWDGRPIKRLRAVDGVLMLLGRRLAMHLMINRDAAAAFLGDSALRDQGLLARMLLAYPESIAGSRLYKEPEPDDEAAIECLGEGMLSLLEKTPRLAPKQRNELAPPELDFTTGAERLWIAFHDHVERQCGDNGELAPIKDVAAKAAEQAARIAGVLAIVADPNAREIGEDAMQGAVALADWYLGEASRMQQGVVVDPKLTRAARLLDWLKTQPSAMAGFRKILNQGPNATRIKAAAEEAIEILMAHGAIVEASARPRALRVVG
jgi:hypothetical protein